MAAVSPECRICKVVIANYSCSCVSPAAYICKECWPAHSLTKGTSRHAVKLLPHSSIEAESSKGSVPEDAYKLDDQGFCREARPIKHQSRHQPINATAAADKEKKIRLQCKQKSYKLGKKALRQNMWEVERCKHRVERRAEIAIDTITQYKKISILILDNYKEELAQVIRSVEKELEDKMRDHEYVPTNPLVAATLFNDPLPLVLFSFWNEYDMYRVGYETRLKPDDNTLPVNWPFWAALPPRDDESSEEEQNYSAFARRLTGPEVQPTSYEPPASYVAPPPTQLLPPLPLAPSSLAPLVYFSLTSEAISRTVSLSAFSKVSIWASAVLLPDGNLFACGGTNPISSDVHLINPLTGFVSPLPKMKSQRYAHGMVLYLKEIYAFGGSDGSKPLPSCEKYANADWEELASMNTPRSFFNPCVSGSTVFIFGGSDTKNCEKYCIEANSFDNLEVKLPVAEWTVAVCISDQEILIVQKGMTAKWEVDSGIVEGQKELPEVEKGWGSMNPVVFSSKIYIPRFYDSTPLQVDLY